MEDIVVVVNGWNGGGGYDRLECGGVWKGVSAMKVSGTAQNLS